MERVEYLIPVYMKHYELGYREAIELMQTDLETAKDNEELKEDSEHDAKREDL